MKPTKTRPRSSLRWKPSFPANPTHDGHGIYGERVFAQVAHYEKVRATDAIGWFDDRGIGVLLPSTGIKRARAFAVAVSDELPELGCAVEIMVHPRLESPVEIDLLRGRGGREFNFVKFGTMHANTDESLHHQHASQFIQTGSGMDKLDEADPRIFFGGRLLRLTCIIMMVCLFLVIPGVPTSAQSVDVNGVFQAEVSAAYRWKTVGLQAAQVSPKPAELHRVACVVELGRAAKSGYRGRLPVDDSQKRVAVSRWP